MTNEKRSCEVKLRINCLIIFIIHLSPVFIINKVASTVESRKHIENGTIRKPNCFSKFFIYIINNILFSLYDTNISFSKQILTF